MRNRHSSRTPSSKAFRIMVTQAYKSDMAFVELWVFDRLKRDTGFEDLLEVLGYRVPRPTRYEAPLS